MFNYEKMYTYLRGFAMRSPQMTETIKALSFARQKHKDQKRRSGEPYIVHPLIMACNAVSIGIVDDNIIATILLHDVVEDCNVSLADLPVSEKVKQGVKAMTFTVLDGETKEIAKNRYYNTMLENKEGTITKLVDRCHNVSSMAGVFSKEKLESYIKETREYVLPLLRKAKEVYPEMSNVLFILKYHICSVINSIEVSLLAEEECEKEVNL